MKRILAVAILLASFCVLANSARAESNPLLTIFEAIQTDSQGTLATMVADVAYDYEQLLATGWGGMYRSPIRRNSNKPDADERVIMSWTWTDYPLVGKNLGSRSGREYQIPTATLEVVVENDKILSAKYSYKFLGLKKSLSK